MLNSSGHDDNDTAPKYHSYSIKESLTVAFKSDEFKTPSYDSYHDAEPDYLDESFERDQEIKKKEKEAELFKKQIPKIALNFTKWKLQQRMVTEIKEINTDESPLLHSISSSGMSKEELVRERISKYTKTFDLLDSLGADNCVDPEDFDAEDMDDELFRNLQIADIEELFSTS